MEETVQRTKVRQLAKEPNYYTRRAYMSSGLTNVPTDHIDALESMLERLFIDVCYPQHVFLYLPHIWSNPMHSTEMSAEDVHVLDRLRIAESDFLILCADYPSFGAGQELEIAQAMGLRTIVFRHDKTKVSRMLLGSPAIHIPAGDTRAPAETILVYADEDDLKSKLTFRVHELTESLGQPESDETTTRGVGAILRQKMYGRDANEIAAATGLSPAFISYLVSNPRTLDAVLKRHKLPQFTSPDLTKYVNPGLWVLIKLCRALDLTWDELLGHIAIVGSAKEPTLHIRQQKDDAFWAVVEHKRPEVIEFRQRVDALSAEEVLAARDDNEIITRVSALWRDDDSTQK